MHVHLPGVVLPHRGDGRCGGAAIGAVIGDIVGGGKGNAIGVGIGAAGGATGQVLTKGKEVRVPAETVLNFKLDADLHLEATRW